MTRRAVWLAGVLAVLGSAARAQLPETSGELMPPRQLPPEVKASTESETPPYLRWMLEPTKNGMFVRLPIVDTDPNRGTTYGVMPILVIEDPKTDRITQIHAPSLTYNEDFKFTPTYRYYYYPADDASYAFRASWSKYEREVFSEYAARSAFGTPYDLFLRFQYNVDASQRFYGDGVDTPKSDQTNYKQEYWHYKWGVGTPIADGSHWRVHLGGRYESSRILDGPLPHLPGFDTLFAADLAQRYQQTNETRATLDYDTRDTIATTTRGFFFQTYAEAAVEGFLSEYNYERYGLDTRWFHPWDSDPSKVFAAQYQYEQILGATPPFWLLPTLGGKYSLRAYGDGRFVDRGMTSFNVEQRFTLLEEKMAGVTTEFQFAPFAGVGTVFDSPRVAQAEYLRPVVGAAVRAVAKPQVVGSVDVGYGQEGVAIFMDINYSF